MFFIPGFIISAITFPGVIVHEFAHQLFCYLMRVPIIQVCYFRFGNPAGFVRHEIPNNKWKQVLISVGPFFVNTILGFLIVFPVAIPAIKFHEGTPLEYLSIYLGVSIAMHAFPSRGDADSMWSSFKEGNSNFFEKALVMPILGFIYLGSIGSMIWLDAIYGVGVTVGLSELLIKMLA